MNILKTCFLSLLFCGLGSAAGAADSPSDVIFDVTFDQYQVRADRSGGKPDTLSFASPDLQLRMWKGVKNNKNALTLSGSEVLDYKMQGNFDPRQGTVSLWVAPVNWKPSDPVFQKFFTASQPGFLFMIYKYHVPNQLLFYIQFRDKNKKNHVYTASAIIKDSDWNANKWHKLDVTWDSHGMKLYVDGVLPQVVTGRSPHSIPQTRFKQTFTFPAASPQGKITLGEKVVQGKYNKRENITAFDELQIWNRPLSAEEINNAYAKISPVRFGEKQEKPLANVPRSTTAVVHDGKVDTAEWQDAVMLPVQKPFNLNASGRTSFSCVYLKRSSTHLMMGLKSSRKAFLTKEMKHDGHVYSDDNFEIHLVSPNGKKYQFVINSAGKVFDSLNRKKQWNSNVQCKADAKGNSWSAELMIPLKSLDAFSASKTWTANFHKAEFENGFHGYSWSRTTGSFLNEQCFGTLSFMDDVPGIQIRGFETLVSGQMDLKSFIAPSGKSNGLSCKAFYEKENGYRADFAEDLMKKAWKTFLPGGNVRIHVSVQKNKKTVYAYEEYLYVRYPLEMTYKALPYKGVVELSLDLNAIPVEMKKKLSSGIRLKAWIKNDAGKILSEKEFTIKNVLQKVLLPLPEKISAGRYTITAEIPGAASPMKKDCVFQVPDMTPFRKKVAVDHTIPAPWTPVKKTGARQFEVWGRQYIFRDSPFPVQITAGGENMLTSAPSLTVDGKPVVWSDFKIAQQQNDVVTLTGKGSCDGLNFKWSGELWFDGMYKITWSMSPANGKTSLKKVDLQYQIPAEFGRYLFKMGREGVESWKNDRIEWEFDIRKSPHTQMTWTSGVKKGLVFWRKCDANWVNTPGGKNLILTRKNQKINVLAKIISRPVELKKTAEYTMVFQATPSRPLDDGWRSANLGLARDNYSTMRLWDEGGGYAFGEKTIPKVWTTPASHVPRFPDRNQKACQVDPPEHKTRPGMYRLAYTLMANLGSSEPEYDYFFESWATKPYSIWGYKFNGEAHKLYRCCGEGIADLMLYRIEKLFRDDQKWIGGIYNDCGSAGGYCENPEHGCGGTDVFGKSYSSSIALSIREYSLRQYKLTRRYNKKLMHHVSDTFVPFAHGFADYILPGETFMWPLTRNPEFFYCEDVKPEFYQTVLNPSILGVGVQLLPQLFRACEFSPDMKRRLKEFQTKPEFTINMLTQVLLHDFNTATYYIMPEPVVKWWGIKEKLNLSKAEFRGYWYNDTFRSASGNVQVSWYKLAPGSSYRWLAIIGNTGRKTQPAALTINKKALGCSADQQLRYYDLWNNEKEIPESALKDLPVKGGHFILTGIR